MIKRFTLLFITLFVVQQTKAQEVYWPASSSVINTGSNATYLVQSVNLENEPIFNGYNLGAFYTNDSGELTCAGITFWSGSQTNIAVYGDDNTTPEKDGFNDGEQITWLAYSTFLEQTYEASVIIGVGPTGTIGSDIYSSNSINIITEFNIDPTIETLIQGCTNQEACNYEVTAQEDDGSCEYASEFYDCNGNCIDIDADEICDFNETSGCTDITACNYNSAASDDDGSCSYASENFDCNGNCIDIDEDTVCDIDEFYGCTDSLYQEFNALATENDGSCSILIISGCTDSTAFNYDSQANTDNSSCISEVEVIFEENVTNNTINYNISSETIYLTLGESEISAGDLLGGFIIVDGQLICVGFTTWTGEDLSLSLWYDDISTSEVDGVVEGETIYWIAHQNSTSFNYLVDIYSVEAVTGDIFVTTITVNELTIIGCLDNTSYNYNENATINDGACIPLIYGCIDSTAFNYNELANTDDGNCTPFIYGCMDSTAFNYNELANTDNGNCTPFIYGCMDSTAFNYNELANTDDDSCIEIVFGCIDPDLCNYNSEANTDDGSCYYITATLSELTYGTPLTVETDANSPIYTWYLNGEILPETNSEYTPSINGEYSVEITDSLGCEVSAYVTINNVSILEQVNKKVSIYPIPASNQITIDSGNNKIKTAKLYTLEGKLIKEKYFNSNLFIINKGQLGSGIYYIQLEFNDGPAQEHSIIFE